MAALQVATGIPQLQLPRETVCLKEAAKIKVYPGYRTKYTVADCWQVHNSNPDTLFYHKTVYVQSLRPRKINMTPADPHWQDPTVDIQTRLTSLISKDSSSIEIMKTQALIELSEWPNYVHIYTDGSLDPQSGKAGYGIHIPSLDNNRSIRLPDKTSAFTCELSAIKHCLSALQHVARQRCAVRQKRRSATRPIVRID